MDLDDRIDHVRSLSRLFGQSPEQKTKAQKDKLRLRKEIEAREISEAIDKMDLSPLPPLASPDSDTEVLEFLNTSTTLFKAENEICPSIKAAYQAALLQGGCADEVSYFETEFGKQAMKCSYAFDQTPAFGSINFPSVNLDTAENRLAAQQGFMFEAYDRKTHGFMIQPPEAETKNDTNYANILSQHLSILPPKQERIIRMRYGIKVNRHSWQEIADRLDMTVGAATMARDSAFKKLNRSLKAPNL